MSWKWVFGYIFVQWLHHGTIIFGPLSIKKELLGIWELLCSLVLLSHTVGSHQMSHLGPRLPDHLPPTPLNLGVFNDRGLYIMGNNFIYLFEHVPQIRLFTESRENNIAPKQLKDIRIIWWTARSMERSTYFLKNSASGGPNSFIFLLSNAWPRIFSCPNWFLRRKNMDRWSLCLTYHNHHQGIISSKISCRLKWNLETKDRRPIDISEFLATQS